MSSSRHKLIGSRFKKGERRSSPLQAAGFPRLFYFMAALITALLTFLTLMASSGSTTGEGSTYSMLEAVANGFTKWGNTADVQITSTIYGYMVPIAITICLCYTILEMMAGVARVGIDNVTMSILIVPLIRFGCCFGLMQYGPKIIGWVFSGSNALVDWFNDIKGDYTATSSAVPSSSTPSGTFSKVLFQYIPGMAAFLSQVLACLIIGAKMFSFRIQTLIRAALMPFAIANIAQGGVASSGMRFVQKFIGSMLFLMSCLFVIKLTSLVAAGLGTVVFADADDGVKVINSMFQMMFTSMIGPFCAVTAIGALESVINEAFS